MPDGSVVRSGTNYSGKFQEAHDASKASIQSRISNLESGGVKGTGEGEKLQRGKYANRLDKLHDKFGKLTPGQINERIKTHYKKGTPDEIEVSPDFRSKMITRERQIERILQKQIDDFNKE
ncbi:TPA: hypothetical protein R3D77_000769 [Bacillus cereus]|nr:hypothetical protein [Bacillus cereus]HDR4717546.1 hypothetical protein [Bacillus cereus]HDR4921424.1 hypothetical protein [Bacillus cereus]HDR5001332.1 hypothetical protein [Bacillus cereus]HEC4814809.1 hypothetical protein [Bacillus cereus]